MTRNEADVRVDVAVAVIHALLVVGFAVRGRERLRTLWRPHWLDRRSSLRLLGAVTGAALVVHGYFMLLQALGAPFVRYSDDFIAAGWPTWSIYVMVSVVPAVFEEIEFRGVIQGSFDQLFSAEQALVMQAVLFSAAHLSPLAFPSHFILGFTLGYVRNQTGSLYAGIVLHALWNAAVVFAEVG